MITISSSYSNFKYGTKYIHCRVSTFDRCFIRLISYRVISFHCPHIDLWPIMKRCKRIEYFKQTYNGLTPCHENL